MFLLTSRAQCLRVADPVNWQKVDLFCHRSIEQTFCDLLSTRCNCEYILAVSSLPLAWQFFTDSDRHTDKRGNLTIISTLKMYAVGHNFHGGNCRGCGQTLCVTLLQKYKLQIFSGMFIGDLWKFMFAKIFRYTVSLWREQLKYILVLTFTLFQ